jgi:hypothetical protein
MTTLYHPRPERWPQFSLRGLLIVAAIAAVLSATVLPQALAAFRKWRRPPINYILIKPTYENGGWPWPPDKGP